MAHQRQTFFDGENVGKRKKMQIKIFPVHLHKLLMLRNSRLTTALGASLYSFAIFYCRFSLRRAAITR